MELKMQTPPHCEWSEKVIIQAALSGKLDTFQIESAVDIFYFPKNKNLLLHTLYCIKNGDKGHVQILKTVNDRNGKEARDLLYEIYASEDFDEPAAPHLALLEEAWALRYLITIGRNLCDEAFFGNRCASDIAKENLAALEEVSFNKKDTK